MGKRIVPLVLGLSVRVHSNRMMMIPKYKIRDSAAHPIYVHMQPGVIIHGDRTRANLSEWAGALVREKFPRKTVVPVPPLNKGGEFGQPPYKFGRTRRVVCALQVAAKKLAVSRSLQGVAWQKKPGSVA